MSLLIDSLRETWGSPVLVGLPKGSRFEHGMDNEAWATLKTSDIATTWTLDPVAAVSAPSFTRYVDEGIHRLREGHGRSIGWHIGLAGYRGRPDLS